MNATPATPEEKPRYRWVTSTWISAKHAGKGRLSPVVNFTKDRKREDYRVDAEGIRAELLQVAGCKPSHAIKGEFLIMTETCPKFMEAANNPFPAQFTLSARITKSKGSKADIKCLVVNSNKRGIFAKAQP